MTIRRHKLAAQGETTLRLPVGSFINRVAFQNSELCLWVAGFYDWPEDGFIEKTFVSLLTGAEVPPATEFVGAAESPAGPVVHIYEKR